MPLCSVYCMHSLPGELQGQVSCTNNYYYYFEKENICFNELFHSRLLSHVHPHTTEIRISISDFLFCKLLGYEAG